MSHLSRTCSALTAVALTASLAGCGSGNGAAKDPNASTPATTSPAPPTPPTSPGSSMTAGAYPTFAPSDYSYRLHVLCYCPTAGVVQVRVKGGAVASATMASGRDKGAQAPAYTRKTINDIIAIANDPGSGDVRVVWPHGADAPERVTVNPVRRTTDAQVTYVLSDIRR